MLFSCLNLRIREGEFRTHPRLRNRGSLKGVWEAKRTPPESSLWWAVSNCSKWRHVFCSEFISVHSSISFEAYRGLKTVPVSSQDSDYYYDEEEEILRSGAVKWVPAHRVRRPLRTPSRTSRGEEDHRAVLLFSAGRPIQGQKPQTDPLPEEPHALFLTARTRRPKTHTQR